jgi:hypothetical protein
MQQEFDTNYPDLGIRIIGVNELGQEFGNVNITEPMPWLQDVDADGDGHGDVWKLWDVEWRDVTILDRENVPAATYNLTDFDLAVPANFAELRQAFLSVATTGQAEGESSGEFWADLHDQALTDEPDWLL